MRFRRCSALIGCMRYKLRGPVTKAQRMRMRWRIRVLIDFLHPPPIPLQPNLYGYWLQKRRWADSTARGKFTTHFFIYFLYFLQVFCSNLFRCFLYKKLLYSPWAKKKLTETFHKNKPGLQPLSRQQQKKCCSLSYSFCGLLHFFFAVLQIYIFHGILCILTSVDY
jgi:hypothetical protein